MHMCMGYQLVKKDAINLKESRDGHTGFFLVLKMKEQILLF